MEAENVEKIKRHDNLFRLQSIILTVQVSAFIAVVSYACFPTSINLRQAVSDCFRLVVGNLFFIFLFLNALIGLIYYFGKTTEKKKPGLYDEYIAAAPSVIRYSMEGGDYSGGYHNNSGPEIVPTFQEVKTVEESHCYDRVVMETNSKSYRRTRSEKKLRSTESDRVMNTTSSRSLSMVELSSEEFRETVESFIMKRKKIHYSQSGVPKLQNGGVDQWQTVAPHLQEQSDSGGTGRHRHRSRRLVGGSGSTGSGHPYLAISN